jgi:hypothetical protein
MRTIAAALIAVTVILGLVSTAGAFDPQAFWEERDRNLP